MHPPPPTDQAIEGFFSARPIIYLAPELISVWMMQSFRLTSQRIQQHSVPHQKVPARSCNSDFHSCIDLCLIRKVSWTDQNPLLLHTFLTPSSDQKLLTEWQKWKPWFLSASGSHFYQIPDITVSGSHWHCLWSQNEDLILGLAYLLIS